MGDDMSTSKVNTDENPHYWEDHHRTLRVLGDVAQERVRQRARYGRKQDLEDGTGPGVRWLRNTSAHLDLLNAEQIQVQLRREYEAYEAQHGEPTWMHLVREEIAEAFQEEHPVRLREELLQVAALAVSWVEALDARSET